MIQDINGGLVEEDDQCYTCEHFRKGVTCPLLDALAEKAVYLSTESIQVKNCGFYKEFKRTLKLVPNVCEV